MKPYRVLRSTSILMVFFLATMSFSEAGKGPEHKRLALVVGNSLYRQSPLKNPTNDARDMAVTLEQLGFQVIKRENANLVEMKKAISRFGIALQQGGVGLFYYAGHAMQVKGQNYLIPVDVSIETESDVEYEAVNAGRVLGKMEDAGNEVNIVILDACRDNPFARSFRTSKGGLARLDAPAGTIIAYATAPGSVAADGSGRNGVYTKHLLENLNREGLTIEEVFKRVRIQVMNETGRAQVPWESSSLTGYFYFNASEGKMATNQDAPALTAGGIKDGPASDELESVEKQLERERLLLKREQELAAIRKERKKIQDGGQKPPPDEEARQSERLVDKVVGKYNFIGPSTIRTFNLIVSRSGDAVSAVSTDRTHGRFSITRFNLQNNRISFLLHKQDAQYRDTMAIQGELSGNFNKIPIHVELVGTNNPYSRIGYRTSGFLVRVP